MTNFTTLLFDIRDRVALITLNRPKAANGVNLKLASELSDAAAHCEKNADIRAVIITGSGRFFSAGGDIKEMASHGDNVGPGIKALADQLHIAMSTFARMKAPVIIAVNGMAAGAGFSLAISGDLVIASDSSAFMMAYSKAGLSPDGGSTYNLPRLIGLRRTKALMLTNRQLTAQEALEWGLINEVVSSETLLERALELASSLATGPLGANGAIKRLLLETYINDYEAQMDLESHEISNCAASKDGREGVSAFMEKRPPDFE